MDTFEDKTAKQLKRILGAETAYTVADRLKRPIRKRKSRWDTASGHPLTIRLPDSVYGKVKARAERRHITVSEFCRIVIEREVIRSHQKKP